MHTYNLVEEPWIGVVDQSYKEQEVSLLNLFENAHNYRDVIDSNPLVVASIYRLLIVILNHAEGEPVRKVQGWRTLNQQDQFSSTVIDYLKVNKEKFDLFSTENPFYQTASLKKDVTTTVKKLSPDFASGSNKMLFSHHSDQDDFSFTPPETARYLLVAQYYSLGGGIAGSSNLAKKHPNFTAAPMVGGVAVYLTGESLYKTLVLNCPATSINDYNEDDIPIWCNDDLNGTKTYEPKGILDYMTFKARHVKLIPKYDEDGNTAVSEMYFTQGYSLAEGSDFRNDEPFFCHRENNKGEQFYPVMLDYKKAFWRDSLNLYQRVKLQDGNAEKYVEVQPKAMQFISRQQKRHLKGEYIGCMLIGLQNNQAHPLYWSNQSLPLNIDLLISEEIKPRKLLGSLLKNAEDIANCIYIAFRTYAENILVGGDSTAIADVIEQIDRRERYWMSLDAAYPALLYGVTEKSEQCANQWLELCIGEARNALTFALDGHLGRGTKEMKASAMAQQKLNQLLGKYQKEINHDKQQREEAA